MEVGKRLRMLRRAKGLSQAQLGQQINVHQMTIRRWETGERCPNAEDLVKLGTVLDTTAAALIGEDETVVSIAPVSAKQQEHSTANNMSYWGEVVDRADEAAVRGDEKELTRVRRMLSEALAEIDGALSVINQKKLAS